MSKEKLKIVYTAKDIEQYLSGKLSNMQMHEMEKAALDDPFLADAIEGYEGMKEKDWDNQLVALRQQIAETGSVAKVIPLHRSTGKWWKVAAAVFLIGSGTILTFILTKDKPGEKAGEKIAQTFPPASGTVTIKDNTALNPLVKPSQQVSTPAKENNTSANGSAAQNDLAVKEDNDIIRSQSKAKLPEPLKKDMYDLTDSVKDRSTVVSALTPPPVQNNNAQAGRETINPKSKEAAKQNYIADKTEQQPNHNFIAQVVAADNSPLPFSNISIKSGNFGTYADVKGNFRLVSTDTILTIEVRSAGYLPRTFALRSDLPQNKIVLLEDEVAIKEKTVIQKDMGTVRRSHRARLVMDSVVNAEPADGWDNYNTYIANNIDLPDDILKKGLHGEVGISFDIKADGAITNIRVDKSLGNDYDEAAKRLIEQGPQWKVKKGKKTSARVKVQF